MTKEFKTGEHVVVAGKLMQIEAIAGDKANCVWFNRNGELNQREFPIQMLGKFSFSLSG